MGGKSISKIYLDYAATTPIDPRVLSAMEPYLNKEFGNPNSLHSFGQSALHAIDRARESIASAINAQFREIVFTGSATEANNLVLRGVVKEWWRIRKEKKETMLPKILISAIEHDSVLETAKDLAYEGLAEIQYLPVDREGLINLKVLEDLLDERTVLVSVIFVSNEIGVVQPIAEISKIIENYRNTKRKDASIGYPYFHTDATQAFLYFDCNVQKLGVDFLTLSAHKVYGPKGVGMLFAEKKLGPVLTGGGQEFGLRSGTQNVSGIVGFGKAIQIADRMREKEAKRIEDLKLYFLRELKKLIPDVQINGAENVKVVSPHILNVFFPAYFAEDLLIQLDQAGVAVSSGAACSARAVKPSHVLRALGYDPERIAGSVRFSFGRQTTNKELSEVLERLWEIFGK